MKLWPEKLRDIKLFTGEEEKLYIRIIAVLSAATVLLIFSAFMIARNPSDIMPISLIAGTRELADRMSDNIDARTGTGVYIFVDRNSDSVFATPAEGRISSRFGWRSIFHRMHYGLDIAAPTGTPIFSSMDGQVTFANRKGSYGLMIEVDHGSGIVTRYGHCDAIMVRPGDYVYKGEFIGEVGNTGFSTGPHLHYEIRVDGVPIDPEGFLN